MFCPNCGKDAGESKFCPECGYDMSRTKAPQQQSQPKYQRVGAPVKKKNPIIPIILVLLFIIGCAVAVQVNTDEAKTDEAKYEKVDNAQKSTAHYEAIEEIVEDILNENGYYVMESSVEWIGYSKYKDMYTAEEYTSMQLGGYYRYYGNTFGGELATGIVRTYWEENESPVIISLSLENYDSDIHIVEYNDEKIMECWNLYYARCFPEE